MYVLSDVVGDHVDVIASGPCAADPTTYAQAAEVMKKFGLDKTSEHALAMDHLMAGKNGLHEETPKPGDPVFDRVQHVVIGNHVTAVDAAVASLKSLGFQIVDPAVAVIVAPAEKPVVKPQAKTAPKSTTKNIAIEPINTPAMPEFKAEKAVKLVEPLTPAEQDFANQLATFEGKIP